MGCCNSCNNIIHKSGIEYDKIMNKIMPLDLILFKGNSFFSNIIMDIEKEEFGNGNWSHCGIVVTTDILPIKNGVVGEKYIWESIVPMLPTDVKNYETNKFYGGLQIRKLSDVIDKENGGNKTKVGWCILKKNPTIMKIDDCDVSYMIKQNILKQTLNSIYNNFNLKSGYEFDFFRSIGSLIPSLELVANKPINIRHKFFCSEFVAYVYEQLGIINKKFIPGDFAPVTFLGYNNIHLKSVVNKPIIITRNWSKLNKLDNISL